jgi:3-methyladenine DNA glycosylase/8-oxoguanine DNA glycosylase
MILESIGPHDFYLALDCEDYFLREHDPEEIYEGGYAKTLSLKERDVLAVCRFNEDIENPGFSVSFPDQEGLSAAELDEAKSQLRRVLGTDINLKELYEQIGDDPLIGPMTQEYYGFKRISGANLYEDAFRDIIRSRISHKPTAKRMEQDVRRTYGTRFEWRGRDYYAFPRVQNLVGVDPADWRDFGISGRKAEYIIGLATSIVDKTLDLDVLENLEPAAFFEAAQTIKGIGPHTAQTLMFSRNRTDAVFPEILSKGEQKGMRRWICFSYGVPTDIEEEAFQVLISKWSGYEAVALEMLYYRYVLNQLKK